MLFDFFRFDVLSSVKLTDADEDSSMGTVGGASMGGSDTTDVNDEADEVLTGGGIADAAVADLVSLSVGGG